MGATVCSQHQRATCLQKCKGAPGPEAQGLPAPPPWLEEPEEPPPPWSRHDSFDSLEEYEPRDRSETRREFIERTFAPQPALPRSVKIQTRAQRAPLPSEPRSLAPPQGAIKSAAIASSARAIPLSVTSADTGGTHGSAIKTPKLEPQGRGRLAPPLCCPHPVSLAVPEGREARRFARACSLQELSRPGARSPDVLDSQFGQPRADDLVAVLPYVCCESVAGVAPPWQIIDRIVATHGLPGSTFVVTAPVLGAEAATASSATSAPHAAAQERSAWVLARATPRICLLADVLVHVAPQSSSSRSAGPSSGWASLLYFVSVAKAALVGEGEAEHVVRSDAPAMLSDILQAAADLRVAAAQGPDRLRTELEALLARLEHEQRAAASAIGSAPDVAAGCGRQVEDGVDEVGGATLGVAVALNGTRELVQRLATGWDAEAQSQRQRRLVLSVYRGDVAACMSILATRADVNHSDDHSITCLHLAARQRDIELVEALLERRAACSKQDADGRCPAHCLPLLPDDCTTRLFGALAPEPEVLRLKDASGTSVVQRYARWAATGAGGKPYGPALLRLDVLARTHSALILEKNWLQRHLEPRLPAAAQEVVRSTELYELCGRRTWVEVWATPGTPRVEVVYLALAGCLPWSLQEPAVDFVARSICAGHEARFTVLSFASVGISPWVPVHEMRETVCRLIEELPIQAPLVLVDRSNGYLSPVLWPLRHRLAGALLLNFDALLDPSDRPSAALQAGLAELFAAKEIEALARRLPAAAVNCKEPAAAARIESAYGHALAAASTEFWAYHGALLGRWPAPPAAALLEVMAEQDPLDPPLPAFLACGSSGARLAMEEATMQLRDLLPGSTVSYIFNSKQWWELEGLDQVSAVTALLDGLLHQLAREKLSLSRCCSRPVGATPRSVPESF